MCNFKNKAIYKMCLALKIKCKNKEENQNNKRSSIDKQLYNNLQTWN